MNRSRSQVLALVLLASLATVQCARVLVNVHTEKPIGEKTAVLVLPGLRNSAKGFSAAKKWYRKQGYDVFMPEYVSKKGFKGNVANVKAFVEKHRLDEYREVHAFVYLMGGWTLNKYLLENDMPNLTRVVYDRSPYQEQAPRIVLETIPGIIHSMFGVAVDEIRDTPYPTIPKGDRQIGIIVESRATPFIRWKRKKLEPVEEKDWLPEAFNQEHDDLIYVFLHHNELYYSFDEIGDDLNSFFKTGRFTEDAKRKPLDKDPFK
jgi:hypothetical protein